MNLSALTAIPIFLVAATEASEQQDSKIKPRPINKLKTKTYYELRLTTSHTQQTNPKHIYSKSLTSLTPFV